MSRHILKRFSVNWRLRSAKRVQNEMVVKWFNDGNWQDNVTLDEAAGSLGLTREELNSSCKMIYGASFLTVRNRIRVESSLELIALHPEFSAQTISSMCGFKDRRNYEHCFEQYYGMTPARYRDSLFSKRGIRR